MTQEQFINILVAEDNEVSRNLMMSILKAHGYQVFGAIDGESAIKVVEDRPIDLAIVDVNMAPKGGLEFIKYMVIKSIDIPSVIVTADDSSHVLMEASALGVAKIVHKPIEPAKLLEVVQRILKRRGYNPAPLGIIQHETTHSAEQLMARAIDLADKNVKSRQGGPFGAVVSNKDGRVIAEAASGVSSRVDPTAHAEVMAIRRAAEILGRADLSDCVLYCAAEPTAMGKALIASVGIARVYYGLSGDDVRAIRTSDQTQPVFTQTSRESALAVFENWQSLKAGRSD